MALPKLTKQPSESKLYDFDFAGKLRPGATIQAVTAITATPLGKVAGAENLTIAGITAAGAIAQCRIAGGTDGEHYKLTALVAATNGDVLELDGILKVKEE